jgi:hypothetical protein
MNERRRKGARRRALEPQINQEEDLISTATTITPSYLHTQNHALPTLLTKTRQPLQTTTTPPPQIIKEIER